MFRCGEGIWSPEQNTMTSHTVSKACKCYHQRPVNIYIKLPIADREKNQINICWSVCTEWWHATACA